MFSYIINKNGLEMSIRLKGDLDIEVTEVMEEDIIPAISDSKRIEFDLKEVPFVDSTGIGLLINTVDRLKKNGDDVQIKIVNVQPLVRDVFEMLQLQEILGDEVQLLGM